MYIQLEENPSQKELEVLIKYAHMDGTIRRLETLLKSFDKCIKCNTSTREVWVNASDIYYIESVDKRTYVYSQDTVYHCDLRLYQLIHELKPMGFVQVSKSCILNLHFLESIKPLINSRLEATLSTGERINVTRKYVSDIRENLQRR